MTGHPDPVLPRQEHTAEEEKDLGCLLNIHLQTSIWLLSTGTFNLSKPFWRHKNPQVTQISKDKLEKEQQQRQHGSTKQCLVFFLL